MVAQADAGREPGAMVVHLEHAATARRAVVGAVRLACLTFLAEAHLAIGFHGERRGGARSLVGRERAVTRVVCGGTRRGEDGGGVGPVEHGPEDQGDGGGPEAYCHSSVKISQPSSSRAFETVWMAKGGRPLRQAGKKHTNPRRLLCIISYAAIYQNCPCRQAVNKK